LVDVVVIAQVVEHRVGFAAGTAATAADRWDGVEQGQQLGDVVAGAASQQDRERVPCPAVIKWCFEPARPRSADDGSVWLSLFRI
jgi:hypothetical protein